MFLKSKKEAYFTETFKSGFGQEASLGGKSRKGAMRSKFKTYTKYF